MTKMGTSRLVQSHSFDDFHALHTPSSLFPDSLQHQPVLSNLGILPRSRNDYFVVRKRSLRQVVERLAAVGFDFGVVLILMQDEEVDSISSDDSIDNFISRLARLAHNRARNRRPFLAEHEDCCATSGPTSAEVSQGRDSSQKQKYTHSKEHLKSSLISYGAACMRLMVSAGLSAAQALGVNGAS